MSDYVDTVDIEGVQYDIQDTETKEIADQNKQDIEALQGSIDYSTEEHLTGRKWLDGRPTYEKTVNCGALPSAATKTVSMGVQDLRCVVKIFGISFPADMSSFRPLPFPHTAPASAIGLFAVGSDINIFTASNWAAYTNTHVTIEYTKSTDSPQP